MNRMKFRILLFTLSTLVFSYANAQHDHGGGSGSSHESHYAATPYRTPEANNYALHGGTVNQAGKYNIEMAINPVMKTDQMKFYLMNKKGKPFSNVDIAGKIQIIFQDGHVENSVLEPSGTDAFVAQLANATSPFICLAKFEIKGEIHSVRFETNGIQQKNNLNVQAYSCPMHTEMKSNEPGKCPKCGMKLIKTVN